MIEDDVSDLESMIFRQFGKVCFPIDGHLLYDEKCSHDECMYIKTVFARKPWWNVHPLDNRSFRSDLFSFFSEEACQYYLPAFMLEILRSYKKADVLVDRLLELILEGVVVDGYPDESIKQNGMLFTFGQFVAIVRFLNFLGYHHDDEGALDILAMLGLKQDENYVRGQKW